MSTSKNSVSKEFPSAGYVLETLFKSNHHIHCLFESHLSAHDIPSYLTGPRMRFLNVVSEAGKIRMSALATKLGIKARTVTQFVDALEKENILVRVPDPNDRRSTFIQLTDNAPPLLNKVSSAMINIAEEIFAPLSIEERSQLLQLLNKLTN